MARLEQLTLGASVRGLVTGATGRVVQVEWFGDDKAVKVTFEEPSGAVRNRPVYGSDEASLELAGWGRAWSFNCDGYVFRLASEASAHLTRYSSTARVSSAAPFRAACIAASNRTCDSSSIRRAMAPSVCVDRLRPRSGCAGRQYSSKMY
jgi:hypothetical protein